MDVSRKFIESVRQASERIRKLVPMTPLIPLYQEHEDTQIYLKLECLQPVGSFKLRGACNTLLSLPPEEFQQGVATISTGNFGHAVAWLAKQLGVPCYVVVPDHVPDSKMAGVRRNGGHVIKRPWAEWWSYFEQTSKPDLPGFLLHPDNQPEILSGNGTVALEILEDLADVDTVLIPYGSGGLTAGMGATFKTLKPDVNVCACEVSTSASLTAALEAGHPVRINYTASFVDGIGSPTVLPSKWDIIQQVVDGTFVMELDEVATTIRLLAERNHVIAEGAGATSVAAALFRHVPGKKIVCVVTGGNIDMDVFTALIHEH